MHFYKTCFWLFSIFTLQETRLFLDSWLAGLKLSDALDPYLELLIFTKYLRISPLDLTPILAIFLTSDPYNS